MTQRTAREVVEQAISDFDDIRDAIRGHRVAVEHPTKTSLYAELIANIRIGSLSGTHCHIDTFPLLNTVRGNKVTVYDGTNSVLGLVKGTAEAVTDI